MNLNAEEVLALTFPEIYKYVNRIINVLNSSPGRDDVESTIILTDPELALAREVLELRGVNILKISRAYSNHSWWRLELARSRKENIHGS